jgi:DNA repair photolyase
MRSAPLPIRSAGDNPYPAARPLPRGRGIGSNRSGRFESLARETFDDGWRDEDEASPSRTEVFEERARSVITRNDSPDLDFDRSINPYRGCEHGCFYCYARPSHAYLGLSPGLDFETKIFAKANVVAALERELSAPGYRPQTIVLGANTDPYQPIERERRVTRQVIEVLARANHPFGIVTKSALVERDIDVIAPMAAKGLAKIAVSVTTLDRQLSRAMEPRASTPEKRLAAAAALAAAGIPVSVLVAPIIPAINDSEIERILERCRAAGASEAGYVLLRLPLELKELAREWLSEHFPDRLRHVVSLIRDMRGGKDYDATFGLRQKGEGPYAWMIGRRFEIAAKRLGLTRRRLALRTDLFTPPLGRGGQLSLF